MKRYLLLIFLIFVGGVFVIALPRVLSSQKETKAIVVEQQKEISKKNTIQEIQSNSDTILSLEHTQQISELYDPVQMYFENIEVLYDYLKFGHIDTVKQKVQFYIHNNVDPKILDCYLDKDSLISENDKITFDITYEGGKLSILIDVRDSGESIDVSVFDTIKN